MAMAFNSLADSWLKHGALNSSGTGVYCGAMSYLMYASGKALVALAISASTWLASLQPNMGSLYIAQYLHDSESMMRLALLHASEYPGTYLYYKGPLLSQHTFHLFLLSRRLCLR